MNNQQHIPVEEKHILIKLLVIVGFFATVALVLFALVQGIRMFPGAFASLASLAESLKSPHSLPTLTVGMGKSIVNSGESFVISWTDMEEPGTYTFTYTCHDGVMLSVRTERGDLQDILCTETLTLPENVQALTLGVTADAQRFTDVPFTLSFVDSVGTTRAVTESSITVVNAGIKMSDAHEIPVTSTPVATTTPSKSTTPSVSPTPKPAAPRSNPYGISDLKITYISVGEMGINDSYTTVTSLNDTERAGLRFQVQNIGTKVSDSWLFTTKLGDETTYTSGLEAPLMPGDSVLFTMGFGLPSGEDDVTFTVLAVEKTDTNILNNIFSVTIPVK